MQSFGEWLYQQRKKAGFTQGQLAQKSGISTSYVSTLERNERHHLTNASPLPKPEIVESLAVALGASIDEARLAAGYSAKGTEELRIHVADDLRVSLLHGKDYTDEDKAEFEIGLGAAYEVLKARIEARKKESQ